MGKNLAKSKGRAHCPKVGWPSDRQTDRPTDRPNERASERTGDRATISRLSFGSAQRASSIRQQQLENVAWNLSKNSHNECNTHTHTHTRTHELAKRTKTKWNETKRCRLQQPPQLRLKLELRHIEAAASRSRRSRADALTLTLPLTLGSGAKKMLALGERELNDPLPSASVWVRMIFCTSLRVLSAGHLLRAAFDFVRVFCCCTCKESNVAFFVCHWIVKRTSRKENCQVMGSGCHFVTFFFSLLAIARRPR